MPTREEWAWVRWRGKDQLCRDSSRFEEQTFLFMFKQRDSSVARQMATRKDKDPSVQSLIKNLKKKTCVVFCVYTFFFF